MYKPQFFFKNDFSKIKDEVYIINDEDNYTRNFGKQWKKYRDVQIDSLNNFDISKNYLENLLFNKLTILNNKKVLEIGCGAGRFTEHIVKHANVCVSIDLSSSIYFNVSKKSKNLLLIKSDLHNLIIKNKFDIVICRGVLQHTPDPLISILKLYEFIDHKGEVFFDIYTMPKVGKFHPKYLIWRPLIKKIFSFDDFEKVLLKNTNFLLKIKRIIKKIFFNSNFISDLFIPVYDYEDELNLSKEQYKFFSILDTLDGIYAKYDNPKRNIDIVNFLKKNNIQIINNLKKKNFFKTKLR